MPASKMTSKGQITVPKAVRDRFGLEAGDVLEFVVADDGSVRVTVPERKHSAVGVLRDFAPSSPVSVGEMRAALRRRAARKADSD